MSGLISYSKRLDSRHKKTPAMRGFELVVIGQLMLIAQLPQSALELEKLAYSEQIRADQQRERVRDL